MIGQSFGGGGSETELNFPLVSKRLSFHFFKKSHSHFIESCYVKNIFILRVTLSKTCLLMLMLRTVFCTHDSPREEHALTAHKHPPSYHWQLRHQRHQALYLEGDMIMFGRVFKVYVLWFLQKKQDKYLLNSMSTSAAFKRFWRFSSDSVFLSLKRFSWNNTNQQMSIHRPEGIKGIVQNLYDQVAVAQRKLNVTARTSSLGQQEPVGVCVCEPIQ